MAVATVCCGAVVVGVVVGCKAKEVVIGGRVAVVVAKENFGEMVAVVVAEVVEGIEVFVVIVDGVVIPNPNEVLEVGVVTDGDGVVKVNDGVVAGV